MVREREEIDEQYRWDLEAVFSSVEEWEEEKEAVEEELEKLQGFEGEIETGEDVLEALELYEDVMRRVNRLTRYASMKKDEDTRNQEFQALASKAQALTSRASEASSFLKPELQELERLEEMVEEVEGLEKYSHFIDDLLRKKPHTRSKEVEEVIASFGDVLGSSGDIYQMLANADLEFPEVERPSGEKVEITLSNFTKLQKHPDREFRRKVYESFYDRLGEFRNVVGETLESSVRKDVKLARAHNYESARKAALHDSKIPVEVYESLVDTVEENLSVLHRHAELKRKALDVDDLKMFDIYMPLASSESPEISYREAKEHVVAAVEPLGEEYQRKVREGLESRWIDVYETEGKRSGAYSGGAYDTKPYILMNYQNDIDSMYTLAHELGHSMHSYFTRENQPYIDSSYDIFVAEVASTLNEALLTRHLLENVEEEDFRRHVLSHVLENFRNTLYRQTMFADFEHRIHSHVEEGEALTPDFLDQEYVERKKKFYRPAETGDRIQREWMRIPHFYWNYYVFQYSTGISAATALSRQILDSGNPESYLEFLKKGGSDYPIPLLRHAGVDMTSPKPVRETIEVYSEYLDRAEEEFGL